MDAFQHLWDTYYTAEFYISSVGKLLFYLHVTLLCCLFVVLHNLAKESKQLFGDLDLSI